MSVDENLLTYAQFQEFPDMRRMCIGTKEGFLIFQEQKGNSLPSSDREWTLSFFYNCGGCSIVCCNNKKMVIVAGEVDETLCDIENSPRIARIYKMPSDQSPNLTQVARVGFETPILKIHLFAGFIVYVFESEIRFYDAQKNPNEFKHKISTRLNPKGVFACSNNTVIAFPKASTKSEACISIYDVNSKKEKLCITTSHQAPLEFIQFNSDSSLIATAAEDGLLIKIYSTIDGFEKHVFRRATINRAQICSMAFNNDRNSQLLAVASSKGTVHIFDLKEGVPKSAPSIYDAGFISTASSLVEATTVGAEARSFCVVRLSPPVSSALSFSADSKVITTLGYDGMVQNWSINKNKQQGLLGHETAADCEKDATLKDLSVLSYLNV